MYEFNRDKVLEENDKLLETFEKYLIANGTSPKLARDRVLDLDIYLNFHLCDYEGLTAIDGATEAYYFFSDFFIRKMATGKNSAKRYGASIKSFYKFMRHEGLITDSELTQLYEDVKNGLEAYMEEYDRFLMEESPFWL